MSAFKIFSLLLFVAFVFGDNEESVDTSSTIDVDGEQAAEFQHESILGSHTLASEFHTLDETTARQRLEDILTQMDSDGDKNICKAELSNWIANSMKKLDEEEASEAFSQSDFDKDGTVTWEEYLLAAYNTDKDKLADLEKQSPKEASDLKRQVEEEETKFKTADADQDGKLGLGEFAAIINPYHFDHMARLEVEHVRKQYDVDGDGQISRDEYLSFGLEGRQDPNSQEFKDQQQALADQFDAFDADKSGTLDLSEIKEWVAPGVDGVAKQEADTMFTQTDKDSDGKLTFQEILERTNQWVGSKAIGHHHHMHHHHGGGEFVHPEHEGEHSTSAPRQEL